jgi:hypothetical protein
VADTFLLLRSGRAVARCDAATLLAGPVDPFSARFVGFENVFDLETLARGADGSLRSWLRSRAGPDGIAFATPGLPADGASPSWEGTVRSVRPGPGGVTVEVVADELLVTLRMAPPVVGPLPTMASRLRFGIDRATLRPLGVAGPTERGG